MTTMSLYSNSLYVTTCEEYLGKEQIGRVSNISKVQVEQFHRTFGHPISKEPTTGNVDLRALRVKLILEEALEFAEACGFKVSVHEDPDYGHHSVRLEVVDEPNLVEMADALGDLDYVIQGANVAFGIPSEKVFAEIHASNMSKLGPEGKPIYREDGKILKGPNYFKPDIAKILGVKE